jgi:hypothetical protein
MRRGDRAPDWFRPIERWRSWSAEREQEFIAIAGPELRGFGYETIDALGRRERERVQVT